MMSLRFDELSPDDSALVAAAEVARTNAYAPYSNFVVGAALLTTTGDVITGGNVENAAYPATICAERSALVSAVAVGQRSFHKVAIVGSGEGPTTPCGICRQALYEFAPKLEVLAFGTDRVGARFHLGDELLPFGFGPSRLEP